MLACWGDVEIMTLAGTQKVVLAEFHVIPRTSLSVWHGKLRTHRRRRCLRRTSSFPRPTFVSALCGRTQTHHLQVITSHNSRTASVNW